LKRKHTFLLPKPIKRESRCELKIFDGDITYN
jgi:hypothetical protein